MRICLLGDFSGNSDEGMKNVSRNIRDRLSFRNNILALNSRDFFRNKFIQRIRSFRPEIIHYLHGPTIRSLIILKIAKIIAKNNARTVCSATKPYFGNVTRRFLPLLRSDLILTQSLIWEELFKRSGFKIRVFPNGVDSLKFTPATSDEKRMIRQKWGISCNDFVVLHVGHIRRNRNLEVLKQLQEISGLQVVIVGGTTNPADEELKNRLKFSGCKVYHRYIIDISSFYKMADLYIFPTKYRYDRHPQSYNEIGAIDIPLSVLEAMACNLFVISTRFGALPRIFAEGKGLNFYKEDEEIVDLTMRVMKGLFMRMPETREQALSLSWEKITARLEGYYETLLKDKGKLDAYRH